MKTDALSLGGGSGDPQPFQEYSTQSPPLVLPIEFPFAPFASAPAVLRRKLWLIKQCLYTVGQFTWVPRLEQQTRLPIED